MAFSSKKIGKINEDRAIEHIENIGFRVVDRNFYARKIGEIDIIAIKDDIWHFIEVKSAQTDDFDPIYNFTQKKLRRIINSTYYYMKLKGLDVTFCIDVVVVRENEIELIENVTI